MFPLCARCFRHILTSKVYFGSKFTSATEGWRFYWLIYDNRWQHEISVCALRHERPSGQFSKSRGLSASVSFLPSPFPPPSFTRSIFGAVILCSRTPQKRLLRRLLLMYSFGEGNNEATFEKQLFWKNVVWRLYRMCKVIWYVVLSMHKLKLRLGDLNELYVHFESLDSMKTSFNEEKVSC